MSSASGHRSTIMVERTASFSFGHRLDLVVTPQALHHLFNVYCHALAVKVRTLVTIASACKMVFVSYTLRRCVDHPTMAPPLVEVNCIAQVPGKLARQASCVPRAGQCKV